MTTNDSQKRSAPLLLAAIGILLLGVAGLIQVFRHPGTERALRHPLPRPNDRRSDAIESKALAREPLELVLRIENEGTNEFTVALSDSKFWLADVYPHGTRSASVALSGRLFCTNDVVKLQYAFREDRPVPQGVIADEHGNKHVNYQIAVIGAKGALIPRIGRQAAITADPDRRVFVTLRRQEDKQ